MEEFAYEIFKSKKLNHLKKELEHILKMKESTCDKSFNHLCFK
jgi:hypothetical protein